MATAEKHRARSRRSYRDKSFTKTAQINRLWHSATTKTMFEKGVSLKDTLAGAFGKLFSRKSRRDTKKGGMTYQ